MVFNIYSYGNAELMTDMFNGMAGLFNNQHGMYQGAVAVALLIGFIVLLFKMMVANAGKAKIFVNYLLISTIFYTVAIGHKVEVNIQNLNGSHPQPVHNVPFGIAGTAWLMSELGYNFAKMFDESYSAISNDPTDLLASSGIPLGASGKFLIAANNYKMQDSYLAQSLRYYMMDCIPPAIAHGNFALNDLYNANDIWGVLSGSPYAKSPAIQTLYFGTSAEKACDNSDLNSGTKQCKSSVGVLTTCDQAHAWIDADLKGQQKGMVDTFMHTATSGLSSKLFESVIQHNIANRSYSPTAGQYLEQSAVMKILNNVNGNLALRTDNQTMMQQFAIAKAESATVNSWVAQSAVFSSTFGFLFSLMQIIIYMISPIILLFGLMGSLGLSKIKNWLLLMLWVPVTFIVIVIIQAMISHMTHTSIQDIIVSMKGFTLASSDFITAKAQFLLEAAQGLETSAPVIAAAIVWSGNYAITSLMSHTGAVTYGSQAGSEMAAGSGGADQVSLDSTSLNQNNLASTMSIGARTPTAETPAGTPNFMADFGGQGMMLNSKNATPTQQFSSNTQTTTNTAHAQSAGDSNSMAATTGTQHAYDKQAQFSRQISDNLGINANLGKMVGAYGKYSGMGSAIGAVEKQGMGAAQAEQAIEGVAKQNEAAASTFMQKAGINMSGVGSDAMIAMGGMIASYQAANLANDAHGMQAAQDQLQGYMQDHNIAENGSSLWQDAKPYLLAAAEGAAMGLAVAGTVLLTPFTGGASDLAIPAEIGIGTTAISETLAGGTTEGMISRGLQAATKDLATGGEKLGGEAIEAKAPEYTGGYNFKGSKISKPSEAPTESAPEAAEIGGSRLKNMAKGAGAAIATGLGGAGGGYAYRHNNQLLNDAKDSLNYGNKTNEASQTSDTITKTTTTTTTTRSGVTVNVPMGVGGGNDFPEGLVPQVDQFNQEQFNQNNQYLSDTLKEKYANINAQVDALQNQTKGNTEQGIDDVNDKSSQALPRATPSRPDK